MRTTLTFLIFILLVSCTNKNNLDDISEILLIDSLDRPFERYFLNNNKITKSEIYDTLGNTCGIQTFRNDTVIYEKFWNDNGFTTHEYNIPVRMAKIPIGEHYGEFNYSSTMEYEKIMITGAIHYFRPHAFRYDSSTIVDKESKNIIFKNYDLKYDEPIISRILIFKNNRVVLEDTVDGNYIMRFREKLIKTPYNNG